MSSTASGTAVIAEWSEVAPGHDPEDRAALLLAAADALASFDVRAVKRAYRRAIEQGLPAGFALRGRFFHGPAQQLAVQDGCLVTAAGRAALLERHRSVLEGAVSGPAGDGEAYFWQIAEPYRLTADGSRSYGTWRTFTGDTSPEATLAAALGPWGQENAEQLAVSGRYAFPTLRLAVEGDLGADADVLARLARRYRDAVAAALPTGFTLDGDTVRGPHPPVEADIKGALWSIDLDAVLATAATPRELLTAAQVAPLIGAGSADSARRTLSRWSITAAGHQRSTAGHLVALFDADQVRAAHARRPGRGRRAQPC